MMETSCSKLDRFPNCFWLACTFLFLNCTDPVTPEFEFQEGLVFIEAFASTNPGSSFVTINESAIEFGVYVVNFVKNAEVLFENIDTGQLISLNEVEGAYQAPYNFVVAPGQRWKLIVRLANGKKYESIPELVLDPVPITNLVADYDPELVFDVGENLFVPGHAAKISFDDPPESKNYYYWSYRTYENLVLCEKCVDGIFRNGECVDIGNLAAGFPYFDYTCDIDCWRIRFPSSIAIFSDEFSNGKSTNGLKIGDLLLHNKEDMVLEVQQVSLTPAAYEYYKVLKDIIDDSSGLNAPPPAALVGNLFDSDDPDNFVFGRFTIIAASTASVFVDRTLIAEEPLEIREPINHEPSVGCPFPPPCTSFAPCSETRFRTAVRPPGWIEN